MGYDSSEPTTTPPTTMCGDNTPNLKCSKTKPYFCSNGELIKYASTCGCEEGSTKDGDSCIYQYQTNPKNIILDYTLRGWKGEIKLTIYEGLITYIEELPKLIYSSGNGNSSRWDFKERNINDPHQKALLKELVIKIQNIAEDKNDQARIAVSIIQHIPYGESSETVFFKGQDTGVRYSRYPYEVLYDQEGVCGEKSELLAFLLQELGYGYKLYYYEDENHEAFGIACPDEYSKENDEYCFIETTGPSIITNDQNDYPNIGGRLTSSPEIIYEKDGNIFGETDMYEYDDATKWITIEKQLKEEKFINIFNKRIRDFLIIKYGL